MHKDEHQKELIAGHPIDELNIEPPKIDPNWPWVLEEVTQRKSDMKIVKHTAIGMTTAQVNKIKISYASGLDHFNFRRGKPLQIEFEDATTTLKLTRQGPSLGRLKLVQPQTKESANGNNTKEG